MRQVYVKRARSRLFYYQIGQSPRRWAHSAFHRYRIRYIYHELAGPYGRAITRRYLVAAMVQVTPESPCRLNLRAFAEWELNRRIYKPLPWQRQDPPPHPGGTFVGNLGDEKLC